MVMWLKTGVLLFAVQCSLCTPRAFALTTLQATSETQTESFQILGAVEKPGAWTASRLEKEFAGDIKTVAYILRRDKKPEEKGEARCLPLYALIQAAKPLLNPKVKNHLLAFVAVVRGDDGYTIAFSLGELTPQVGGRSVYIALDRNGKPLRGDDGPVQLLSPDDHKPARWVHGVASITLVDGFALTGKQTKTRRSTEDAKETHEQPKSP